MFPPVLPPTASRVTLRTLAIAALIGSSVIAGPVAAASADSVATNEAPPHAASHARKDKGETIEQRIDGLHKALQITADEESNWQSVAQAMRDNAANGRKLVAERTARAPASVSAVDDLKTYEKFTQAHVDGLKNLIASFSVLYDAMPDAQKKLADHVFESFGRANGRAHS